MYLYILEIKYYRRLGCRTLGCSLGPRGVGCGDNEVLGLAAEMIRRVKLRAGRTQLM